jgi:hypothetical protein
MNLTPRPPDPEALLRQNLRDTSPAFEARWVALKRDLRGERAAKSSWRWPWPALAAGSGLLALLTLAFFWAQPGLTGTPGSNPVATQHTVSAQMIEEMLTLNESLAPALGVIEPGMIETLVMLAKN